MIQHTINANGQLITRSMVEIILDAMEGGGGCTAIRCHPYQIGALEEAAFRFGEMALGITSVGMPKFTHVSPNTLCDVPLEISPKCHTGAISFMRGKEEVGRIEGLAIPAFIKSFADAG